MAVLQKMRTGVFGVVISVLIALSLLYFIAPMDDLMTLFGKPQNVGEVAGKGISYEDYLEYVDKYTTLYEITNGTSSQNEQTQQQIRDNAWQEILNKYMFIKNAKAAGINVGEAEMVDLTIGNNLSPVVAQNQMFLDNEGNFSVDAVVSLSQAASTDANAKIFWNYLQQTIQTNQYLSKYAALFTASSMDNALTLASTIEENNTTADIDMVVVNYGFERDSTIKVTSSEVKNYYKNHKKQYKQRASRDAEYVVYEVIPSAEDIAATNDKIAEVYDEFGTTDNVKSFLLRNSDRSLSDRWYKAGELKTISEDIDAFVFGKSNGVSPIYRKDNTFYAAKVMASANIPDSVYVRHILLQGDNAKKQADSLCKVVTATNFASNATLFSADKNSAADGITGNLGWMTQSYMIPGMESVMTARVGKPYVITTQYGSHVVLVEETTRPVLKKQVAILEKTALASKETFNTYYNQANQFAVLANGTAEGYKKAIDSLGVYSHKANNVYETQSSFGSVDNAREITRWIFDAKKAGKASGIITVNNNFFFVVALNAIHEEGYKPVKEVAASISNTLYTQKRNAAKTAAVAAQIEGLETLDQMAETLGTEVSHKSDITFSKMGAYSVEPAVLGAIAAAEDGQVYGPVQGNTGVYMIKVTRRDVGSFYTEDDAKNFNNQISQYNGNMLMSVMTDEAEVVDNRARYF